MEREPEPNPAPLADDIRTWIARERDAAWTAKLVILRVQEIDDIEHFGEKLREHERHVDELLRLAPALERHRCDARLRLSWLRDRRRGRIFERDAAE